MNSKKQIDDEDIKLDFSKINGFFSKNYKILILLVLILIPVIVTGYVRFQAYNIPVTDDWARNSVNNYYKNQLSAQISSQYPNLPVQQRNSLVEEQWAQFSQSNSAQIEEQIRQTSNYFKSGMQYSENGNTYTFLGDLDSYYYLRQARNIKENGMVCDILGSEGNCVDTHALAPNNWGTAPSMHPYATFYLYKFLNFFNPKINLMQSAFILPTLIAMIAVVAAFFIGRRLMNNVAGFFAAMFLALSPLLITRTMGSDTDIWNITFPLIIIWLFLEAFEAKKLWLKVILMSTAGLFLAFFNFAWGGWWYIFYFIIAALIGHILFMLLKKYLKYKSFKKIFDLEIRDDSVILGVLFFSTLIFVSLIYSFNTFLSALKTPFVLSETLKVAVADNLWPNVLTTVAELNEAGISTIISQSSFGIPILFSLALLGIVLTLVKKKPDMTEYVLIGVSIIIYLFAISPSLMTLNYLLYLLILMVPLIFALILILRSEKNIDIKPALILMIWFIGMIYTSFKGVRFILLLIPVFSISLGVAIGYLYQYFSRLFNESFNLSEKISKILVFILLLLLLIVPIQYGFAAGRSYIPSMTTGWWDSLTKIRQESATDAIITSWWDFGHWFKYVADRKVTFDGASQMPYLAYWAGKSLQTDSEARSVGIIKMLACGSNNAFDEVNKKINDTEKSENIISEIILLNRDNAYTYLKNKNFNDEEISNILKYTHCKPPEVYYITSGDMVGKAGVWAHFGLWDIDRAYIIQHVRPSSLEVGKQLLKERFNYSDDEATKVYYEVQSLQTDRQMNDWISPWPGYATGSLLSCSISKEMKNIVICPLGLNLGNNGQGNVIIDRAIINLTNPENSFALVAVYDQNGRRYGENTMQFTDIVIATEKDFDTYKQKNATFNLALLLNVEKQGNTTTYTTLVADPLLIQSTFTKLFFLEGKGTTKFEKFSDITDITGTRIIVWKVKW